MKLSPKTFALLLLCSGSIAGLAAGCAESSMQGSTTEYVDDAIITKEVSDELVQDMSLRGSGLKVETVQGVVSLSGFADTAEHKARAAEIAAGVHGVRSVNNNILLR